MMRPRTLTILVGAAVAVTAVGAAVRHGRGGVLGRSAPGGILIGHAGIYDTLTGRLLGSAFRSIAADVAAVAADGAQLLEVGCGPGHLSIRLARAGGCDVTGLDLDPVMIERARRNAVRQAEGGERVPSFVIGDVASLPFPDASFDLVVSTFSMHHWDDSTAGLVEIGRVLRPGGRALVWDLGPGAGPLHRHLPDPVEKVPGSGLRVVSATRWRWPGSLHLAQRLELARADDALGLSGPRG